MTFESQGKYDDAIKAYDKAIELNPHDTEALRLRNYAIEREADEQALIGDKLAMVNTMKLSTHLIKQ
jgi:tetratricopeptide (TPR) repeat protein